MLLTASTHVANVDEGLARARRPFQSAFVIISHSIRSTNFFCPRWLFHLHIITNLILIVIINVIIYGNVD